MIAIARKVIILDIKKEEGLTLFGIAAIILALAVSFYLFRISLRSHPAESKNLLDPGSGNSGGFKPPQVDK